MRNTTSYESPFCTRYASEEMQHVFSADKKFTTGENSGWLWHGQEMELGLPITPSQVKELEDNVYNIDYDVAEARERVVRHDVMSHVYAYGQVCPHAKGIIHLGATSCYVGDNTDIIVMREALQDYSPQADQCASKSLKIRYAVQGNAGTCLHPSAAGTADYCRQACHPLDE